MPKQLHPYESLRKKHTIALTIVGGLCSAGLVVALIIFCYQSSHLRM